MIEKKILSITNETEWNSIVWDYMDARGEEYPDAAFDEAENAILDMFACDCEAVEHLRGLGII